jgi:hypothetical protein
MDIAIRFWSKVDKSGECWIWTAARDRNGYGRFRLPSGHIGAHRMAWILEHGPIDDETEVLHSCDNPPCVRHLFTGTHADNMADAKTKGRTSPPPIHRGDEHWTHQHPERIMTGENHPRHRFSDHRVTEIVQAYHQHSIPVTRLCQQYEISKSQLYRFVRGER